VVFKTLMLRHLPDGLLKQDLSFRTGHLQSKEQQQKKQRLLQAPPRGAKILLGRVCYVHPLQRMSLKVLCFTRSLWSPYDWNRCKWNNGNRL